MSFSPLQLFSDSAYADIRDRRSRKVIYTTGFLMLLINLHWIVVAFINYELPLLLFNLIFFLMISGTLYLVYSGQLVTGIKVILVIAYCNIMLASFLFEGMSIDIHNKTVYALIPVLAGIQYFGVYFSPRFRMGFTLICFISLAAFQTPVAELNPYLQLEGAEKLHQIADIIVPFSVVIVIAIFSVLAVDAVLVAERSYNNANNTLNTIMENMLPAEIASRLKTEGKTFADAISDCSVIFANVEVPIESQDIASDQQINLLRQVFESFEEETEKLGLEKIKTIGSSFMAVSGAPTSRDDHADAAIRLAINLKKVADAHGLNIRVGINSGPAVAGLIGKTRFVYDLWGDTVNVASRLESHGQQGKIHISSSTADLIDHASYLLEKRENIKLKGRGEVTSFFVNGVLI